MEPKLEVPEQLQDLSREQLYALSALTEAVEKAAKNCLQGGYKGCLIHEPFPLDGEELVPVVLHLSAIYAGQPALDRLDVVSRDSWWLWTTFDGLISAGRMRVSPEEAIESLKDDLDAIGAAGAMA